MSADGQHEVRTGDGRRTTARVPDLGGPGDVQEVGWIPERDILIVTARGGESDGHSWLMWPTGTRQRVGAALRAEGYNGELGRVVTSPDGLWAAGVTEENMLIRMALGRTKAEVVAQDLSGLTTSATIPPRFFTLVDPPEPVAPYMRASAISNQGTVAVSATRHIGDADYFVDALFWLSRDGSILFGTPTEALFDLNQDDTTPAIVLHQSRDSERVVAVLPPFATRLAVASPNAGAAWSIVERDFDSAIVDDAVRFAAVRTTDGDVSITSLTGTTVNRLIARNTRAWKRSARPTDPRLSLGWALDETAVVITCSDPG